jgi:RHH-type rel operon transcriptional repressor/antitoxin RelB
MLAVRLEAPLETQIDLLAKARHTTRSNIVRQAIIRFLEDCEDLELARIAKKNIHPAISLSELRKHLGLDSKDK